MRFNYVFKTSLTCKCLKIRLHLNQIYPPNMLKNDFSTYFLLWLLFQSIFYIFYLYVVVLITDCWNRDLTLVLRQSGRRLL